MNAAVETEQAVLRSANLAGPANEVPSAVLVAPWGEVAGGNGPFLVDAEAGAAVLAAFAAEGHDLPIDYEHQTLGGPYTSPTGQAPAAGWIKKLHVVEGEGIYAEVEWTPQAREQLAARQYRYLSPVALIRREDRRMVALHSAALTNKPAIAGMRPIVNRTAVDEEAAEEGSAEELLAAARSEVRELREALALRQAQERVMLAMSAGKLTEAQRDWAVDFARRLPAEFDAWQQGAPVIVCGGRTRPPGAQPGRDRPGAAERARSEYRGSELLQTLTSEEAFVRDSLRAEKR